MIAPERIYDRLTREDLERLKELALREHEEFFKRNPHLKDAFSNSLIGICLCQGAALHYLNPKVGIKDFDIWHFYLENESTTFPYRALKRDKNGYKGRPIDFIKRVIPKRIYESYLNDPKQIILEYLLERNTRTKKLLLEKPIVGLFPDKIFGKPIWEGNYDVMAVA